MTASSLDPQFKARTILAGSIGLACMLIIIADNKNTAIKDLDIIFVIMKYFNIIINPNLKLINNGRIHV